MTPQELLERVAAQAPGKIVESHSELGEATVYVEREEAISLLGALRDQAELGFDILMDLTVVDFLGRTPRFEVVYHLTSLSRHHRLRVKVRIDGEDPWVYSAVELWKSANWLEREAWDMFGVRFSGHPDLRRILMYEEFVGHPLRKDYPVDKRQPLTEERDPIARDWKF
jgi:NADH-quinone oxidoreductase subunit C